MYGREENCGDLLFSGHTAFTTVSLLSALSGSIDWPRRRRHAAWLLAAGYFMAFVYLMLAARKHYTVDVFLGVVVPALVFVVFGDTYVPACFK